ncbi:MAG TPA: hypothetical protein VKB93_25580 [Thermoanaerobaculia bacterium]|nr:hypothetical protein [Thermoanaerobaculia bacterium]
MRTFLIILAIVAVVIGGVALYLALTTPSAATPVRFPLSASQRALIARVPAAADSFALIPTAALLHKRLLANPVTRDAVERWTNEHDVPKPWMLGGADAVVWRRAKKISYAIRLDPFRAFLVRLWLMSSTNANGVWDGSVFVIGQSGPPLDARALNELLALTNGLPEGDFFAVQRDPARGMFPPIGRPSVTSVRVTPAAIDLVSRANVATAAPSGRGAAEGSGTHMITARHPRSALLSATFARPPRILGDVQRLLGTDLSTLLGNGGSVALYDIDAGTFLPRPKGVVSLPASEQSRQTIGDFKSAIDLVGETRDTGSEVLVSFDRQSMPLYIKDTFEPAAWPATAWSLRIDAQRMPPILDKLSDSRGLRLVASRVHRASRDLNRWTEALRQARSIEAADSISGGFEELRVRIASK